MFTGILLKNTSIKPVNSPMIVPTPYSINNHTYQVSLYYIDVYIILNIKMVLITLI